MLAIRPLARWGLLLALAAQALGAAEFVEFSFREPQLAGPIALAFVVLLTVANLRGVKEASTVFSIPTYLFIVTVVAMIVTGLARCFLDSCPTAVSSGAPMASGISGP